MSCYCDYDRPEFYLQEERKAIKAHTCCECGTVILPGQKYEYVSGKWDGVISTFKTCTKCVDLRESLSEVGCPAHAGLYEEYYEYISNTGLARYDQKLDEYIYPDNHIMNRDGTCKYHSNMIKEAA